MVSRSVTSLFLLFLWAAFLTACGDNTSVVSNNSQTTSVPTTATTTTIATTGPSQTSLSLTPQTGNQSTNIPPYQGFKPANLGVLERAFNQSYKEVVFGVIANPDLKYYLSSEPPEKALAYYKAESSQRKYQEAISLADAPLSGKTITYAKIENNSGRLLQLFYFQLDEATKMQVQYGEGKVGDYVFIIINGEVKADYQNTVSKSNGLQKYTGSGNKNLSLSLPKGIIRIKAETKTSQSFNITLLYAAGQPVEQPISISGSYTGVTYVPIYESNNYGLEIKSTDDWAIEIADIKQLGTETSTPLERSYNGQGDSVLKVKSARTGPIDINLSHSGNKNFTVTVYDKNGTPIEILANKTGAFSGTTKVRLEAADYYIGIKADGDWKLQVN